jgi:hydrogenase nickel incorporation protein HypB
MCVECGCSHPVPFGIKVIRALAPGLLKANTVAAGRDSVEDEAAPVRVRTLDVKIPLLEKNDRLAAVNRRFFRERGMLALNLVSSPGTGKTTLLGRTLDEFGQGTKCAVIVGDLETDNDARRLARPHVPVAQITTGTACHLDADMVAKSIASLDLAGVRVMFIENVGNLVCPAEFDLGEELRVVLLSTTEGEDKPLKYAPIFKTAQVVLLTKIEVADALGFNRAEAAENIRRIAPTAKLIQLSARTGEGMDEWYALLRSRLPKV